jgi:uncharacterized protein (TIGR03437 family)
VFALYTFIKPLPLLVVSCWWLVVGVVGARRRLGVRIASRILKSRLEVPGMLGLREWTQRLRVSSAPPAVAACAIAIPIILGLLAGALHAAGPIFSAILGGSGQEYATAVTSDTQGNVYVVGLTYSSDFPVTPGVVQTKFGGTCDAFITKVGPDGKVIWSTYLGGILDDWATGVALDRAGNVLVTGWTRSANFPLANALMNTLDNGASPDDFDAFVAKLDPSGAKLLYSTFLGGDNDDGAAGIAVDSAGNAYVAVNTNSTTGFPGIQNAADQFGIVVSKLAPQGTLIYSFLHPNGNAGGIALDTADSVYVTGSSSSVNPSSATQTFGPQGSGYAMVFKISPDGSGKIYETALGGSVQAGGTAIAVDSAGEAYVVGSTSSVDFPLVHPFQSSPGARPLWKSTNSGTSWTPMDDLPFAIPQMLVVDPATPSTVYEATGDLGIFKSLDGGGTWTKANSGIASTNVQALAIDPVHSQTLYAATSSNGVYKTVDGGNSWTLIDSPALTISQLAVDAKNPDIVWEIGNSLRKSTNAGVTWNSVNFPGPADDPLQTMALDPRVSGHLFGISNFVFCGFGCTGTAANPYLYRSVDGGASWIQIPSVGPATPLIVDGSTNPSTVYDGLSFRSVDGGVTWSPINPPPGASSGVAMAVDPSGTLYVAVAGEGLYLSRDHAQTWIAIGSFIPPWSYEAMGPEITSIVPTGSTGTLYAATDQVATSGFVTKLSADGSSIVYSTYLRGHASDESSVFYLAEPNVFLTPNQNWISAIALDAAGNATVAGGTRAVDFPVVKPTQAANAGLADAFVATMSADGNALNYSTYFGGSDDDGALGVTVDSQGDVIFAGQTWSSDFPNVGGLQPSFGYGNAFVVKLAAPGPPAITSVLNGASYQPGIEAGSWVMIQGTNLANTYPGRTWAASEVDSDQLPTSLDGVSVTIDRKPAFVNYISPTQINVQAPTDGTVGKVDVVVTNNGAVSAAATAQLQAVAPAFFKYLGTNYAVASLLPDHAMVGNPSVVPGTIAAKPGDTLELLGTGFGATNPAVPAGTVVSGAPAVVTAPTVTVGGVAAQVVSAVLGAGGVGVYQVTIQLPATVPTGAVAVQASVGGVQTQAGVLLFVSKP